MKTSRRILITGVLISGVVLFSAGAGFTSPLFYSRIDYPVDKAPASAAIGDLNKDGKPDLVVANSLSTTVSVLLGKGYGTFQNAVNYSVGDEPWSVAIGDLNGDGGRRVQHGKDHLSSCAAGGFPGAGTVAGPGFAGAGPCCGDPRSGCFQSANNPFFGCQVNAPVVI